MKNNQNKIVITFEEAQKKHPVEIESIRDQINNFTWKMGKYKIPHNQFPFPESYEFYYDTWSTLSTDRKTKIESKMLIVKLKRFDSVFDRELEKKIIKI